MEEKIEKTPEELKRERFEANPDNFVEMQDLMVALKRSPQGPAMYYSFGSRREAIMARAEIDIALLKVIMGMDDETLQAKRKKVGGIIQAARNRLFRR